jgi:hypothetical protein
MARKRSRGFFGVGSVIQVKPLSGVGQLSNPNSAVGAAVPILLGGGAAALVTLGIQSYMAPKTAWETTVFEQRHWVGAAAGGLVGLAMMNMTGKAAGISALTAALTVGIAFAATEAAAKFRLQTAGFGAVVAEYSMRGLPARGVGAIAMEPTASRGYGAGPLGGTYGEDVQLRGLGNVNQSAFGTAMFGH